MPEKHDRTAESHAGVSGRSKNNFFSSFTYTGWWGSYIMHEKHDRTAESHAWVLDHTLGLSDRRRRIFFFFYIYKMEAIPLCLRNTIEQLDHTLGLSDRRRRIFFLLLHLQDGGSFIMLEIWITHWGPWTVEEEFFFFFYIHRMGGGSK